MIAAGIYYCVYRASARGHGLSAETVYCRSFGRTACNILHPQEVDCSIFCRAAGGNQLQTAGNIGIIGRAAHSYRLYAAYDGIVGYAAGIYILFSAGIYYEVFSLTL